MAVSLKMLAFRSLEDARQTEAGLTATPPRQDLWLPGGLLRCPTLALAPWEHSLSDYFGVLL